MISRPKGHFRRLGFGHAIRALTVIGLMSAPLYSGELRLQLKDLPQTRFAGYHIAQQNGFYQEEGLEVTILPADPDITPMQVMAGGGADVVIEFLPAALVAREKGLPLTNIAQVFRGSTLALTCLRHGGLSEPQDLAGKTLAIPFQGSEYSILPWLNDLGLKVDDGPQGIRLIPRKAGQDPLQLKQANCAASFGPETYSLPGADRPIRFFPPQPLLEDGLYVLDSSLKDDARVADLAGFLRASMKGWHYIRDNSAEAASILHALDQSITLDQQLRMIRQMAEQIGSDPHLDRQSHDLNVQKLLDAGVVSRMPSGSFTHLISDQAQSGAQ